MPIVDITNTKNSACATNDAMSMPYVNPTQELMATSHTIIAAERLRPSLGLSISKMTANASTNVNPVQKKHTNAGKPP